MPIDIGKWLLTANDRDIENMSRQMNAKRGEAAVRNQVDIWKRERRDVINRKNLREARDNKKANVRLIPGHGGTCFCGKTGLKQSTYLKSDVPITLIDYKNESKTGTMFNLGCECVNSYKSILDPRPQKQPRSIKKRDAFW